LNIESKWKNQEVPDIVGIVTSSGRVYSVDSHGLKETGSLPEIIGWADIGILASSEILGGAYRLVCGESCGHGSMGVIVMEDTRTRTPVWSFVSNESNPFDQIEEKGGYVVVLSTSGAVFRFRYRNRLEEATLSVP
jgi:hypothetical protein